MVFFFSSRRRHTRFDCDWSSDVCSSDLSKDDPAGPADIVRLGAAGLFEVVLRVNEHWAAIERTLRKYVDLPAALADACLIRCAEIHDEPRILTFEDRKSTRLNSSHSQISYAVFCL